MFCAGLAMRAAAGGSWERVPGCLLTVSCKRSLDWTWTNVDGQDRAEQALEDRFQSCRSHWISKNRINVDEGRKVLMKRPWMLVWEFVALELVWTGCGVAG